MCACIEVWHARNVGWHNGGEASNALAKERGTAVGDGERIALCTFVVYLLPFFFLCVCVRSCVGV
jgi:hypothetical protein